MASKFYFFTGICKWAKLRKPDDKYNKYELDLYLDEGSWKKFEEAGLGLKIREDEDGKFVKFRRPAQKIFGDEIVDMGPPKLVQYDNGEYQVVDVLVGNGSFVEIRVRVYDTQKGKGHTLEAVAIHTLVPYENDNSDLPF